MSTKQNEALTEVGIFFETLRDYIKTLGKQKLHKNSLQKFYKENDGIKSKFKAMLKKCKNVETYGIQVKGDYIHIIDATSSDGTAASSRTSSPPPPPHPAAASSRTNFIIFDGSGDIVYKEPEMPDQDTIKVHQPVPEETNSAENELSLLLDVLPAEIGTAIREFPYTENMTEIVLDVKRRVLVRYMASNAEDHHTDSPTAGAGAGSALANKSAVEPGRRSLRPVSKELTNCREVTLMDLESICAERTFTSDNRAGIGSTLHRLARKMNVAQDTVIGLTIRIGRMVPRSTYIISDIAHGKTKERPLSVLLLGAPGAGKTTLLREMASTMALTSIVEIVDSSNEIAGSGDAPHMSVGNSRRMVVPHRSQQHDIMIEAVQNHMPERLIIDEIGTRKDAEAAADIAHRGVSIVGTAHGLSLSQLLRNPELQRLLGGCHSVVLGDGEARSRNLKTKSVQERKSDPVFDIVIELRHHNEWYIYHDVARAVDDLLAGKNPMAEVRQLIQDPVIKCFEMEVTNDMAEAM